MAIDEKFLKPYDPKSTEEKIYKAWEESGYFNPDKMLSENRISQDSETFSMVLPPPNVTGTLHTGHALMLVIEDIMVRHARMSGKKTLWIPGTDHAAIATQSKVEKLLQKEGLSRHDLGREKFLEKVHTFASESHDTIVGQVRRMGASIDWSREAFTLDDERQHAVYTAFKKMYDDGLIYRKDKVVNWDPKGQTVISDDEIIYQEEKTILYTFKYSKDFPIAISTTRPETKIGDTAVAVHPKDERYSKYIGQIFNIMDFCGTSLTIKIIGDEEVDKEFGTGAVGITPNHSHTDSDMAERHNLPRITVIDEKAKMIAPGTEIDGLKVKDARQKIVDWLRENNLIEEEKEIVHNIATAERTGAIVEPLPKLQWFIDVNKEFTHSISGEKTSLKKLMRDAVLSDKIGSCQIKILPERFEKIYFQWIDNLRDWCISRQIWYGHRIPVWYKGDEIFVDVNPPTENGYIQDTDTLDTWFSSGLWTFSTLGWPKMTEDLKTYHPTSVLETGYDIIFFWVARMILMSTYLLGQIPFKTVYLHGLVRDEKGRKMSKSLGNIIDPVDLIDKFGADATRMALIVGNGPGNDLNLSENKVMAYKKFANKLWNITRFIMEQNDKNNYQIKDQNQQIPQNEYVSEFQTLQKDVQDDISNFRYYLASEKLYHYIWHNFADKIIEESKDNPEMLSTLNYIFSEFIRDLHPFMPFITEEIWQSYKKDSNGNVKVADFLMINVCN